MYKINQFASFFNVTTQTLKLYEKRGLIKPNRIDDKSNYRYYSAEQMVDMIHILKLKRLGFTLTEILAYRTNAFSVEEKINLVESKINDLLKMKEQLNLLKQNKQEYITTIKTERKKYIICKNIHVDKAREIEKHYFIFLDEILKKPEIRLKRPYSYYVIYMEPFLGQTNFEISMCVEVEKNTPGAIFVPEKKVISIFHVGDYDNILNAHTFLKNYLIENNITMSGNPHENYIVNPRTSLKADQFLTEIEVPIE